MHRHPFDIAPISKRIWQEKYQLRHRHGSIADATIADTFARVANAAAAAETGGPAAQKKWSQTFTATLSDFTFLPAGRILAGAGTERDVTLFNCFVMGVIEDDLGSIFEHVREAAVTMQKGGGIGHDFSVLRPKGALVKSIGADASGPVSFMNVWDAMCRTIMSAGARRGAMMGTLRCDHPDIETFIDAKSDPGALRNFNMSVLVPDAFMEAVRDGADWDLVFDGKVYRTVKARDLWARMTRATYEYAEPGVIFIDRVNARNNLSYCETIFATNPCGEQPLPPYGACLLGSINLARLIDKPLTPAATLNTGALEEYVRTAVRFLDNIIDVSPYPLASQAEEARAKRRIGLGVTGLADALVFSGLHYDSDAARDQAATWTRMIQEAAYYASAELAAERGAFPLYKAKEVMESPNVQQLAPEVRAAVAANGIRNGCLTSIAPTGTISLIAGNVSSGIEPIFAIDYDRRVLQPDDTHRTERVTDYAVALHRELHPTQPLPATAVTAEELSVDAHLKMQASIQPWVDSSISKTINCPADMSFEAFQDVYLDAYRMGLKGCTTFRPNSVTGAVLSGFSEEPQAMFEMPGLSSVSSAALAAADADEAGDIDAAEALPTARVDKEKAARLIPAGQQSDIVFMTEPLERADVLIGQTYKLKWPGSAHAIYVTINDIEQDGRQRPFEIFINTKNLDHQAWTVALTRMISAVFRRGGDVSFVIDELKAIYDPQGGQWMNGRYVPSLIAAIGDIIEQHMRRIGFLGSGEEPAIGEINEGVRRASWEPLGASRETKAVVGGADQVTPAHGGSASYAPSCPHCGAARLQRREGCWFCSACNYSHCG